MVGLYAFYLLFRALFTLGDSPYAVLFWLAEVGAAFALAMLALPILLPESAAPEPPPGDSETSPAVDVVIPACGASLDALRRTATAAIQMRGRTRTILMGDSPELVALAKELGCEYEEIQEGNWRTTLNSLLPSLSGSLLAIFEPAQIPHVDFLATIAPWFADTEAAMVQVAMPRPQWSSLFGGGVNSREAPVGSVPNGLAIRDRWNAVPWLGTNALFRRSALVDVGGFRGGAPWRTSTRLQGAGWRTRYCDRALCMSLEDDDSMLIPPPGAASFSPREFWSGDLTLVQRVVLWGDHLAFAPAVMGALYLLAPLLAIWFSWSPVRRPDLLTLLLWITVLGPSALGLLLIDRHAPDLNRIMRWSRGVVLRHLQWRGRRGAAGTPSLRMRVAPTAILATLLWAGANWVGLGIYFDLYEERSAHFLLLAWAGLAALCAGWLLRRQIERIQLVSRCRTPLTVAGECRRMKSETDAIHDADWGDHIECVIRDISGQGIGVLAYEELELGQSYLVSFEGHGSKVSVRGTVVYGEPGGGDSEHRYYLRPAREDRCALARYARRAEAEQLRAERPKSVERARQMVRRAAKRRSPRFAAELAVQIDGVEGGRVDGSTINVSATGLALRASRGAALDSVVLVRVLHPALPRPLQARVVRVVQKQEDVWEMGLDLLQPNAALAHVAAPQGAPLFLDPWDEEHDAISRRGLRNDDDEVESGVSDEVGDGQGDGDGERESDADSREEHGSGAEEGDRAEERAEEPERSEEGVGVETGVAADAGAGGAGQAVDMDAGGAGEAGQADGAENREESPKNEERGVAPESGRADSAMESNDVPDDRPEFLPRAKTSHELDAAVTAALNVDAGDDTLDVDELDARLAELDAGSTENLPIDALEDAQLDELLNELEDTLLGAAAPQQAETPEGDA